MSDGQVQSDHRVTTSGIDEGVGVVARLRDVGVLVPCEGILRRSRSVTRIAVVDRQVQGHHAVAAVRVRECVRQIVATGGDVSMLVPVEAVAGNGRSVTRVAVVDRQVQGHHAVAAVGVREGVRQVVATGGDARMLVPVQAVAGNGRGVTNGCGINREAQCDHRVATIDGGQRKSCVTRCDEGYTVPRIRQLGLTNGIVKRNVVSLFCSYSNASVGHFITIVGYRHIVSANGNGDGLASLARAPQVVGSHIGHDGQNGGLVLTDTVFTIDVEEWRDDYGLGGEGYLVAPVAGAVRTAIGANLDRVGSLWCQSVQCVRIRGNIEEVGLVTIDADLPFGGVSVLGPR